MVEQEAEMEQGTAKEVAEVAEEPAAKKVVKKPKKVEADVSGEKAPAKAEKKEPKAAVDDMIAAIKNMTVLDLAELSRR